MDTASIVAPAKVNLTLDITGRRDDGYHFMRMIMQSVSLHNVITINYVPGGKDVSILCSSAEVCTDESNTAYKAAMAFFQFLHQPVPGLEIVIENNIPFMAGLGCASADAAAVLVGLNHITGAGLSNHELCEIGVKVGADVPFCILGGTQLVEGIGEIFTPLPNLAECYIVIAKPDESISTAEAFARYDRIGVERRPDTDGMIGSIVAGDIPGVGRNCSMSLRSWICRPPSGRFENGCWKTTPWVRPCQAAGARCSVSMTPRARQNAVSGLWRRRAIPSI